MNWKHLRHTLGFDASEGHTATQPPFTEELVPGELKATIHLHAADAPGGAIPCWCYVSEGLARHKQREAIFTVVRQSGETPESYPREPLEFFRTLLSFSKQGRIVRPGDFTGWTGPTLLGFHGFVYMEPVWRPPGSLPPGTWMAAVGLTDDELAALQEFGSARVLSILGNAERFYPAPYWTERNRPSRISPDSIKQSFLIKVRRVVASGFSVFREQKRIVLRVHADRAGETVKALRSLPPETPLALLTRIDFAADGALVWLPGETHNQAHFITPQGSAGQRICGSFVVFLPGQEADQEHLLEDGYALHLTSQSWGRLRNAILAQDDIRTDVFELRWIEAGFEEYLPSPGAAAPPAGLVLARKIVLLQPDAESSAAIGPEALVGFVKYVDDMVQTQFPRCSAKGDLFVTIKIQPGGRADYELATRGAIENASLQQLWGELQKLAPPAARNPIGIRVEFEIGN